MCIYTTSGTLIGPHILTEIGSYSGIRGVSVASFFFLSLCISVYMCIHYPLLQL